MDTEWPILHTKIKNNKIDPTFSPLDKVAGALEVVMAVQIGFKLQGEAALSALLGCIRSTWLYVVELV